MYTDRNINSYRDEALPINYAVNFYIHSAININPAIFPSKYIQYFHRTKTNIAGKFYISMIQITIIKLRRIKFPFCYYSYPNIVHRRYFENQHFACITYFVVSNLVNKLSAWYEIQLTNWSITWLPYVPTKEKVHSYNFRYKLCHGFVNLARFDFIKYMHMEMRGK